MIKFCFGLLLFIPPWFCLNLCIARDIINSNSDKKNYYSEKDIVITEYDITTRFEPDIDNKCLKAEQDITYKIMFKIE